LTGKEHLEVYAHIKGIPKDKIKEQVEYILKCMDLEQYANVLAGTYSGGNKRKLSVAMALIGNPSVVFLDEPSAGMDPEARKNMWKILGNIKKKKSAVILTTHSMEEAEALCDRMTIMVRGRLKCIGTSTWIKNKFGDGYELEVKIEIPNPIDVRELIKKLESYIGQGNVTLSNLDGCLEYIGYTYLRPYITNIGPGAGIFSSFQSDGFISKEALASWCLIDNQGFLIKAWLEKEFNQVEIIEHYNLMSKFKLKRQLVKSIGYLFSVVEAGKERMRISDYAICMTSLEQIFNRFAKRAELEEIERLRIEN
jgi:ATP-binding cassette subfamily A (ABC1) protein 3